MLWSRPFAPTTLPHLRLYSLPSILAVHRIAQRQLQKEVAFVAFARTTLPHLIYSLDTDGSRTSVAFALQIRGLTTFGRGRHCRWCVNG